MLWACGAVASSQDKSKTIAILHKKCKRLEAKLKQKEELWSKEEAAKLGKQKKQYEEAMARHLELIDKLLKDKKTLTERVEALSEVRQRRCTCHHRLAMTWTNGLRACRKSGNQMKFGADG